MEKEKNNEEKTVKDKKLNFFKKVWYSIDKIEKYSELSAEGLHKAISYFFTLIMIIAITSSVITVYKTSLEVKEIAQYINEKAPDFSFSDGIIKTESDEAVIDDNFEFGKIIFDAKTESEEQINKYTNELNEESNAVIILKDKMIVKGLGTQGSSTYNYKDLVEQSQIKEFTKQELIDYMKSSKIAPLYMNLAIVLFIYAFVIYLSNTLFYVVAVSIVGYLSTLILKLRIRYIAVLNMAMYSITLPILLNTVYLIINAIFKFEVIYFDLIYILVSSIYMIAAIFILKSEFNKKQGQVQKIIEVQEEVKKEIEEDKQKEENKENNEVRKENKKTKDEDKKEEKDNNLEGEEPEGSNA